MPRNRALQTSLAAVLIGLLAGPLSPLTWAGTRSDVEKDLQQLNLQLDTAEETFTARSASRDTASLELQQGRQKLIENTSRVQALESRATSAAEDLEITRQAQQAVRATFSARQQELGNILAAMQRLGAEPAASLLVAPGGAEEAARAGLLLEGLMTGLREKAGALRLELDRLARLEVTYYDQQEQLGLAMAQLNRERIQLDRLVAERQRLVQSRSVGLADAETRVRKLAAKALTMQDLLDQLQTTERRRPRDGDLNTVPVPRINPRRRQLEVTNAAVLIPGYAFVQPVLLSSRRFQKQKGALKLPVSGRLLFTYGDQRANGETVHGLTVNARRGAQVRAPVDGKIVFAGPFRSYGQLLIIAPADGFHLLLAGLGSTDVQVGQWLLAGEPVGRMTGDGQQKGVFTPSKTSLYIELRKDGEPINPAPWFNSVPGKVTGS